MLKTLGPGRKSERSELMDLQHGNAGTRRLREAVADAIYKDIESGDFSGQLPSMEALANRYDVARLTVRSGIQLLQSRYPDLLDVRQGLGTFVRPNAHATSENARENFESWKYAVQLPETFPQFLPLTWEKLRTQGIALQNTEPVRKLVAPLTTAYLPPQPTIVAINPGQGATTLFRFAASRLESASKGRVIPVRLSVSRLDPVDEESGIDTSVRLDILAGLLNQKWDGESGVERVASGEATELLRESLPRDIQFPLSGAEELGPDPKIGDEVREFAPRIFETPLPSLIRELSEQHGVAPLLLVDLSGNGGDARAQRLLGTVEHLVDAVGVDARQWGKPPVGEMYFGRTDLMSDRLKERSRTLEFSPRSPGDVYAILDHHYRPHVKIEGDGSAVQVGANLASVMHSNVLELTQQRLRASTGKTFADTPLREIPSAIEETILSLRGMRGSWADVTFHLGWDLNLEPARDARSHRHLR